MFGYITPDSPYLFKKDETLYRAIYCGLCKGIGGGCGQLARTALTYDMAFTSAIAHNICGTDVKIEKKRCVAHWFVRRPVAAPDGLTVSLGCVNTILAYYKLCDDRDDGDGRGALKFLYKRGYKRAAKLHPAAAEIVKRQTEEQAALEKAGCAVLDIAAEPTAAMTRDLSDYILGEHSNESTRKLFYCLGKWIYIIDAIDDYDKDVKKGRYNVIFNAYGKKSKREALEYGGEELKFMLNMLFAEMREALAGIKFNFNHDLTDNIILRGIPYKSREIFYGRQGAGDEQKKS